MVDLVLSHTQLTYITQNKIYNPNHWIGPDWDKQIELYYYNYREPSSRIHDQQSNVY
jgi:hypothetical protein